MSTDARWFNGRFPAGPYLLEVVEVDWQGEYVSRTGDKFDVIEIIWRLVGTDACLHWRISDTEKARWAWEGFGPARFQDLTTYLVGRKFICLIGRDRVVFEGKRSRSDFTNKVNAILAEVVDEDPHCEICQVQRSRCMLGGQWYYTCPLNPTGGEHVWVP
jgi:hypothetical protein